MSIINKKFILLLFIITPLFNICLAENPSIILRGKINADNINVRSDSTVNAEIVCKLNRGDNVDVIYRLYDWYKIRLPKTAPAFIKKGLLSIINEKTAVVLKDKVNIRLRPNETSAILGSVGKNEVITVLKDSGDWYKIEPIDSSFGWVHKNFVDKVESKPLNEIVVPVTVPVPEELISVEGKIRPKTMKRIATHKLITPDHRVFLLRADKENLDSMINRKANITGKLISPIEKTYCIIEVTKIEAKD